MQQRSIAIFILATLAGFGCGSKNQSGTKSPGVIEQAANDVEQEIDHADETVDNVGEDVSEAAEDVEEKIVD